MNATDWLTSTDAAAMLRFVTPRWSERKLRLFACACVRRFWEHLPPGPLRQAVLVAERHADARASRDELRAAMHQASTLSERLLMSEEEDGLSAVALAADNCTRERAAIAADFVRANTASAAYHLGSNRGSGAAAARIAEYVAQCSLLREIGGDPFHPIAIAPAWLTFQDGAAPRLAQQIYEHGCFDEAPILADALEEAGCTEVTLVQHLRAPGVHVRGCWALDLLLGLK